MYDFLIVSAHQMDFGEHVEGITGEPPMTDSTDEQAQNLHAFLSSRVNESSPADIRNVLSTSS